LRADGSVITWGGVDSSAVASALNGTVDVVQVSSTGSAFAALRTDGSVITWGAAGSGGDSSAVSDQLSSNVASLADITTTLMQSESSPPVFSSASVNGNTLIIKYTENSGLNTLKTAPNSAFSVSVNGVMDPVLHVSAYSSNQVMLSLTTTVTAGQNVRLSYSDPTNADDTYALQDLFGNDAVSFTDATVTLVGVSA
jgi:uncharacterized repeat protein (TIGR02059 family)